MKKLIILSSITFLSLLITNTEGSAQVLNEGTFKFSRTLSLIDNFYVDSTDLNNLTEKAIVEVLRNLDPHSTYISAKDVKEMNEPLLGNFDGIGIQFNLLRDTIIVIEPILGGPSEKVGLRAGDRIITINGEKVAGIGLSTAGVRSKLMGPKGTKADITVFRRGELDLLEFSITRDKIPINSLDAAYMLDNATGYIKLNKFAATTVQEFTTALASLRNNKMENLVLDLRGNGGGYMLAATELTNFFFADQKLLVYLIGRKTPRQDYNSKGNGSLSKSRLVVLTDEGSASASEILAGAIQDWDRGIIMGRRTFGKGLVQNGLYLTDGSMIRLTIARYYTPAGRSIQSPYNEGYEKYISNFYKRFSDGEMVTADSVHFPDSVKYRTLVNNRIVFGGGGIMPDVFVAADTSSYSDYYREMVRKGILNTFTLEYFDRNRTLLTTKYKTFAEFRSGFAFTPDDIQTFIKKGESEGIKFNESQYKTSESEILLGLKALVATNLWQTNEYFQIVNENDNVISNALKIISDKAAYNKVIGYK
jgi:carboxyl-terminal processing protease